MSFFITFEGIEGCGKTTQLRLLAKSLADEGREVITTREPGGCPISDKIRSILLDAENKGMTPTTELLLYAAARAQHIAEVVAPALKRGAIVLCDRFTDATLAYQGYGRQIDLGIIATLNSIAAGEVKPHMTLLLDCPVETGLSRAMARINAHNGPREERFELEPSQFHRRVRDGYHALAANEPERFIVVDAARDVKVIAEEIRTTLAMRFGI